MSGSDQTENPRIQLWCQNYDPEPQGVAPIASTVARGLAALGDEVLVLAAHPHYPRPDWGVRIRPYRENRDGIPVLRLPTWPGRDSGLQRIRQELSSTLASTLVAPILPASDALLAVSPSLTALSSAMLYSGLRGTPWVLWIQDIVTDGAQTTGELAPDHPALKAARAFEKRAYDSAAHIVVISDAFRSRLVEQGVPPEKISLVYNPMTRVPEAPVDIEANLCDRPMILAMGNIGRTQGMESVVEAFEADRPLEQAGATLTIAGAGVAFDSVKSRVRSERVRMPGVLNHDDLEVLLRSSRLGLVSQKPGLKEFNLPSKLMNYMGNGLPVIASVDADSETARIVRDSGTGWVTDPAKPEEFARRTAQLLDDREALGAASEAGFRFAHEHFSPERVARSINGVLKEVIRRA